MMLRNINNQTSPEAASKFIIDYIKSIFKDNNNLLESVDRIFLQTEFEKDLITSVSRYLNNITDREKIRKSYDGMIILIIINHDCDLTSINIRISYNNYSSIIDYSDNIDVRKNFIFSDIESTDENDTNDLIAELLSMRIIDKAVEISEKFNIPIEVVTEDSSNKLEEMYGENVNHNTIITCLQKCKVSTQKQDDARNSIIYYMNQKIKGGNK